MAVSFEKPQPKIFLHRQIATTFVWRF